MHSHQFAGLFFIVLCVIASTDTLAGIVIRMTLAFIYHIISGNEIDTNWWNLN